MVRLSKQEKIRSRNPHRRRAPSRKTGPLKDNLPNGYKEHSNALEGQLSQECFIPKIS